MKRALLAMILLTGCATPSAQSGNYSANVDTCNGIIELYELAMDARLRGMPESRTYSVGARNLQSSDARQVWAEVVIETYDLPRAALTGAERADILSGGWDACMGYDNEGTQF